MALQTNRSQWFWTPMVTPYFLASREQGIILLLGRRLGRHIALGADTDHHANDRHAAAAQPAKVGSSTGPATLAIFTPVLGELLCRLGQPFLHIAGSTW